MKVKELHEYWQCVEIGRDSNGFTKAETWKLFEIMKNDLPLLIHDSRDDTYEAINGENQLEDWLGDIFHHPYHDKYIYQK